jgi:hypothetical protein
MEGEKKVMDKPGIRMDGFSVKGKGEEEGPPIKMKKWRSMLEGDRFRYSKIIVHHKEVINIFFLGCCLIRFMNFYPKFFCFFICDQISERKMFDFISYKSFVILHIVMFLFSYNFYINFVTHNIFFFDQLLN